MYLILGLILGFLILSFGYYIIFSWFIPGISKWVNYLTEYQSSQTLIKRIYYIFFCNFFLAIPLLATVLYILNPSKVVVNTQLGLSTIDIGVIVALAIIPGLLLILRLLSNPTRRGIIWKVHNFTIMIIKSQYTGSLPVNNQTPPEIRKLKDDISSFYSTLIFGTLLYIVIQFCADYFINGSYSQFLSRYTPSFPLIVIICYIVAYLATLILVVIVGELILDYCEPIDKK
jgi:hypothetical protein